MNILLTGATGFVGQHFLYYNKNNYNIIPASVREGSPIPDLSNINAIIHLGGKAHEMQPIEDSVYFSANAELPKQLAIAAKKAGVKQFVYVSSVKVYGNITGENINETTACVPDDAYGQSKLLGEQYLQQLEDKNFIVSIVRPPLIYGAGVKGNMLKLVQLAQKNMPLPFGNISNKRSLVFVYNLIALINTLLYQQAGGIFIAGDEAPLSTTQLVRLIRQALDKKPNLIYIPGFVKTIIKKLRYPLYIRLFGSFVIDNAATNKQLHFTPPFSTEEGVNKMMKDFKKTNQ